MKSWIKHWTEPSQAPSATYAVMRRHEISQGEVSHEAGNIWDWDTFVGGRCRKHKFYGGGGHFSSRGRVFDGVRNMGHRWWNTICCRSVRLATTAVAASINFIRGEGVFFTRIKTFVSLLMGAATQPRRQKIAKFIPHLYPTPRIAGDPVRISRRRLVLENLEWLGYHMLKKVWWYAKPFRYKTRAWQTAGRTDKIALPFQGNLLCEYLKETMVGKNGEKNAFRPINRYI